MKLQAALPTKHGLGVLAEKMIDSPRETHIAVVMLDCAKVVESFDSDNDIAEPVARIRKIEVLDGKHADDALEWLLAAQDNRIGQPRLNGDGSNE